MTISTGGKIFAEDNFYISAEICFIFFYLSTPKPQTTFKKYIHKVRAMYLVIWLRFGDYFPKELVVQLSESLITVKCGHH